MRNIAILFMLSIAFFSCKSEDKKEYKTYTGDFIYQADAAVLQTSNFVYGVTLDKKSEELADQVSKITTDAVEMAQVTIKGEVKAKESNQEGWDSIITIKEIVKVAETPSQADIKLETKSN